MNQKWIWISLENPWFSFIAESEDLTLRFTVELLLSRESRSEFLCFNCESGNLKWISDSWVRVESSEVNLSFSTVNHKWNTVSVSSWVRNLQWISLHGRSESSLEFHCSSWLRSESESEDFSSESQFESQWFIAEVNLNQKWIWNTESQSESESVNRISRNESHVQFRISIRISKEIQQWICNWIATVENLSQWFSREKLESESGSSEISLGISQVNVNRRP